ncbi:MULTISPECIES: glucosamine-6-phosphate deaminase [unclassified Spirosoma]|uniref:glucosamine-6-phosphate deaminase n=1 Tax=unclassified Spirosoma TaxID=2621999 RepID=UPI00095AFBB0|nr:MULTISPECIES: glucosamine-6-phosphate deaminase [unclassified Spirosoma]OJW72364.1 MAG: glucosamine-6-phosphate deaminase [Spirosoma sp. 48-14]
MDQFTVDQLSVAVYPTRQQMGQAAANDASACIRQLLAEQDEVNIIFAAAASQNEFLTALVAAPQIDWNRINAFHMDEYTGLPKDHPQRFGNFLHEKIFGRVPFKQVFYLNENSTDDEDECTRYSALLEAHRTDITCMGIGENTHLAFNDPHVANFNDPYLVKIIDLDEPCKQQQVNEGCFASVSEVPPIAYTLTIPALLRARYIFCMVPGANKAAAVKHTLVEAITEKYPSTSLRTHPNARLYLDEDSAALIEKGINA